MFKNPRIAALLRTCLGIAALALACTQAHAQAWPTRTIVFVVPYAVGGPADALARMVARKMSETTGQPVVVKTRPAPAAPSASPLPSSLRRTDTPLP